MIGKLLHTVLDKFDAWRDKRRGIHNILCNINLDLTQSQKKVLLCYLDYRMIENSILSELPHTNIAEFIQIINEFISRNYVIDVCGHDSVSGFEYVKNKRYDYIFGMGEVFRHAVAANPEAYAIAYFTENPYWFSEQEEYKRVRYFHERRGRKVNVQRTGRYYHKDDEALADAIICMGNPKYFEKTKGKVYQISPSAFKNPSIDLNDIGSDKNTFLVFGTEGIVHKGIDLLLEVFAKHGEWTLLVCGKKFKRECKMLGYKLSANVQDCGFVNVDSARFAEICQKSRFIVLPSCSEGKSTAIETGMRHGLIPIIMQNMIVEDPEEYFLTINEFRIESIEIVLQKAVALSEERKRYLSEEIYHYANEQYSLKSFKQKFHQILHEIVRNRDEDNFS